MYWTGTARMFFGVCLLVFMSGCAQVIAYNQPSPIDRDVLAVGNDRAEVAGTLGNPIEREDNQDGTLSETYTYTDGGAKNSAVSKTLRIVLYSAGDLFTLFLDQVIWMPAELAFRGDKYTAEVTYDKNPDDHRWVVGGFRETELDDHKVVREVVDKRQHHT